MKLGLMNQTKRGKTTRESSILITITITKSIPISAMNFRSDRKYHGRIPSNIIVAVNMMALPVVVRAADKAAERS